MYCHWHDGQGLFSDYLSFMIDGIIASCSVQVHSPCMKGFMDAFRQPNKRLSAEKPLYCPWFVDEVPSQALTGRQQKIKKYASKFMKVANTTRPINAKKNVAI